VSPVKEKCVETKKRDLKCVCAKYFRMCVYVSVCVCLMVLRVREFVENEYEMDFKMGKRSEL
jgi:hypothetical protein